MQIIEDASEALSYYGERLNIRRSSLQSLLHQGNEVSVQRIRLFYEGGVLKPKSPRDMNAAINDAKGKVPEVEVLFQ